MNFANYQNCYERDFPNYEEKSMQYGAKNFTSKFQMEKQILYSPNSISTSPSETCLSRKSDHSLINMINLQDNTPSTAESQNVFDCPQTFQRLSKTKLNFDEKEADYKEERVNQYDFYTVGSGFTMKSNSENSSPNSLLNSGNLAFNSNKLDSNSQIQEFNLATSENAEGFTCNPDSRFNHNNSPYSNYYNFNNVNYNYNNIDNAESVHNFNKINRTNPNYNFTPNNYYNNNYCKYFIDENSKKNLIKNDNINNGNNWYNNNINYNICNITNKATTQKKSQEINYINSKLSYKERKREVKSNKKTSNSNDEHNKIILENVKYYFN
jgi:hypothetical protein